MLHPLPKISPMFCLRQVAESCPLWNLRYQKHNRWPWFNSLATLSFWPCIVLTSCLLTFILLTFWLLTFALSTFILLNFWLLTFVLLTFDGWFSGLLTLCPFDFLSFDSYIFWLFIFWLLRSGFLSIDFSHSWPFVCLLFDVRWQFW